MEARRGRDASGGSMRSTTARPGIAWRRKTLTNQKFNPNIGLLKSCIGIQMTTKYPSIETVALRLAVLLKRTGKTRARVSDKTLRILSGRTTLRDAFVINMRSVLEEYGVVAVRLDRGGFALIATSALEGAPPALVKNLMPDFKRLTEEELWNELELPDDEVNE